ncbi:Ubiquitin domain [Arabidopsis suecica]|uniref:Ubiquitin domain n=1 Tax=Arabidopsis suecica TaxID=45249 RepID=A0A8T2HH55_ARASU|nr:Ubiquitin domain [Arabidopsis suecica]
MFLLKSFAICLKVKLKILLWTDKENAPKMINEVKLINGGKILENNKTLSEARSLITIGELPGIVTTMHVVLRPPLFEKKKEKLQNDPPRKSHCVCCIL